MAEKLQLAVDGRSDPDAILVSVECADNSLMGHDAKLTITAEATVLDSRPVNSKKKLFTKEFRLTSTSQSIAITRKDLHVYTYRGKEINIDLQAELRVDDGVLFDTKVKQEIVIEGPPRKGAHACAKHLVEPKDRYRFWSNWRAIPLPAKIITLGLAVVAAIVGAVNTTVGVHDQFSPEGQTYFYSHRDSDGDGQSPLVNSGALTGGAAIAIWVAMRRQLRKYMTFKVKKPLARIDRRTEISAGELFHGRSRVPLHNVALRVVACNMEKGQYTRGSGSKKRTVSFKEPVRGAVLFEKRVAEIPGGDDVEKHFPDTFSFAPLFDELYPPNNVSGTHGFDVYWEIQLIHETFVDQEIVGSVSGVAREEFLRLRMPHPLESPMLRSPPIFDDFCALADADFRGVRLVEFFGASGAGKSTAIEFLCREHRDFRAREPVVVAPGAADLLAVPNDRLVIVEEVSRPRDLRCVAILLRRGATVLVASHLRPAWSAPLGVRWRRRWFRVDRDWRKISRYLDAQGVEHTADAVQRYCRRFGANYVDAALIMERRPGATFDAALAHFERFCKLELNPD